MGGLLFEIEDVLRGGRRGWGGWRVLIEARDY